MGNLVDRVLQDDLVITDGVGLIVDGGKGEAGPLRLIRGHVSGLGEHWTPDTEFHITRFCGRIEIQLGRGDRILDLPQGCRLVVSGRPTITIYTGFGFLTDEELFELRQTEPRLAP